jgi:hypothetical protein
MSGAVAAHTLRFLHKARASNRNVRSRILHERAQFFWAEQRVLMDAIDAIAVVMTMKQFALGPSICSLPALSRCAPAFPEEHFAFGIFCRLVAIGCFEVAALSLRLQEQARSWPGSLVRASARVGGRRSIAMERVVIAAFFHPASPLPCMPGVGVFPD